jgi:dTDP-4-dehydrorhamnose reductase
MDKARLLLIGASGFLGSYAARKFAESFDVFTGSRVTAADSRSVQIDITDASSVDATFQRVKPDAVLLLAALSDIDRCEAEPELAFATNVRGPENVANACARSNAKLLFTSSAAVFDGSKHGYTEDDAPTPLSVYGETKARAEAAVLAILPCAIILRIALAVGFAGKRGTNAMLENLSARWACGSPVATPTFEYRNPIDTAALNSFMLELFLHEDACGIFHAGAKESISRYVLNLKLAERMGYPSELVLAQTEPAPGRAPRGLDHFLLTDKIRAVCSTPIPSCDEVIARCFDEAA